MLEELDLLVGEVAGVVLVSGLVLREDLDAQPSHTRVREPLGTLP